MKKTINDEVLWKEMRELPMHLPLHKRQKMFTAIRKGTEQFRKRRIRTIAASSLVGIAAVLAIATGMWQYGSIVKQPGIVSTGIDQPLPHAEQIIKTGDGGTVDWWREQAKKSLSADDKTVAGFAMAILKRDLGVAGERPAGVDQFFEPSKADLKKKLAAYDVSSPQAKEIYLIDKIEDPTGIVYHLKTILGSWSVPEDRLEGTLEVRVNKNSHKIVDLTVGDISLANDKITRIQDVPLHPKLAEEPDPKVGYYAGKNGVSIDQIKEYYEYNMPLYGWKKTGDFQGDNQGVVWKMAQWSKENREFVISLYDDPEENRIYVRFEDGKRNPVKIAKP